MLLSAGYGSWAWGVIIKYQEWFYDSVRKMWSAERYLVLTTITVKTGVFLNVTTCMLYVSTNISWKSGDSFLKAETFITFLLQVFRYFDSDAIFRATLFSPHPLTPPYSLCFSFLYFNSIYFTIRIYFPYFICFIYVPVDYHMQFLTFLHKLASLKIRCPFTYQNHCNSYSNYFLTLKIVSDLHFLCSVYVLILIVL
jgi:hypothetical protein